MGVSSAQSVCVAVRVLWACLWPFPFPLSPLRLRNVTDEFLREVGDDGVDVCVRIRVLVTSCSSTATPTGEPPRGRARGVPVPDPVARCAVAVRCAVVAPGAVAVLGLVVHVLPRAARPGESRVDVHVIHDRSLKL